MESPTCVMFDVTFENNFLIGVIVRWIGDNINRAHKRLKNFQICRVRISAHRPSALSSWIAQTSDPAYKSEALAPFRGHLHGWFYVCTSRMTRNMEWKKDLGRIAAHWSTRSCFERRIVLDGKNTVRHINLSRPVSRLPFAWRTCRYASRRRHRRS